MTSTNQYLRASFSLGGGLLLAGLLVGGCAGEATGGPDDEQTLESSSEDLVSNPLTPVLSCMDRVATNTYKAHFGYTNSSARSVRVPIGALNFFVPLPKGQGQPIDFAPGNHPDVFTVSFSTRDGWDRLAWWLSGRRALATKNTPICAPPQCALNDDCDDDNPCTTDSCASGHCTNLPGSAGTTCAHANVCNAAGQCVECLSGAQCDDDNPCTSDLCSSGHCAHGSASGTISCGHGGTCSGGSCVPPACTTSDDCDDDNPCTADSCASSACSNPPGPAGVGCAHGNVCNASGACVQCLTATQCDDDNPCTTDACSSGTCSHGSAPSTTACGHGGLCNGAGACSP